MNSQPNIFDVSACLCSNLRKAARTVTQAYDAALLPSDIKITQFILLSKLSTLGEVPVSTLADALVMDRTTLTRNLKPLISRGWIRIAADDDRRVRLVSLTREGQARFEDAHPHWQQAQVQMTERLGTERLGALLDDLSATIAKSR